MPTTEELMTTDVKTCSADETVSAAVEIMWSYGCGCVPIVGDQNEVVGMITDRDVCMAAYFNNRSPSALLLRDVMTKGIHCCLRTTSIATAQRIMREQQVRRLPIVSDEGRLIGLLSLTDLVIAAERLAHESAHVHAANQEPHANAALFVGTNAIQAIS